MPYRYPEFAHIRSIQEGNGKRYCLEVSWEAGGEDCLLVIQKNPSRAGAQYSDHTINRVLNYIHRNHNRYFVLKEVGTVVFLNLIPWYETYSSRLARHGGTLEDRDNLEIIAKYLSARHPCIIGWGNPPPGLRKPYEALAQNILNAILRNGNPIFTVGDQTRLGYPRHGQIWGYRDPLKAFG